MTGVAAIYATKYWLALDEVYITDLDREAENNAGESHTWGARVVVFGPGPRSTSVQDWYNAIAPPRSIPPTSTRKTVSTPLATSSGTSTTTGNGITQASRHWPCST